MESVVSRLNMVSISLSGNCFLAACSLRSISAVVEFSLLFTVSTAPFDASIARVKFFIDGMFMTSATSLNALLLRNPRPIPCTPRVPWSRSVLIKSTASTKSCFGTLLPAREAALAEASIDLPNLPSLDAISS